MRPTFALHSEDCWPSGTHPTTSLSVACWTAVAYCAILPCRAEATEGSSSLVSTGMLSICLTALSARAALHSASSMALADLFQALCPRQQLQYWMEPEP